VDGVVGTERAGEAGIQLAVDGCDGEVDVPMSARGAPWVRHHAVH